MRLGPYRIVRRIAVGGMAEVLLALREGPGGFAKPVALKRILPHLSGQPEIVALFENEARLAARMSHPGIVQVYDFSRIAGQYVLAQEYVAGADLRQVLRRARGPVPPVLVAAILVELCGALHHAHERGVIHGDVSPSNILLGFDGAVKLADFGVAQRSGGGGRRGKRSYAAPEQLAGLPYDRRADLYALGVVAHDLLTGHRYPGTSALPRSDLGAAAERCLQLSPGDRFATAEELELVLERVLVAAGAAALAPRLARYMSTLFTEAEVADQRGLEEDADEATAPLPPPDPEHDTGPPAGASSSALPVPDPPRRRGRRRGTVLAVAAGLFVGAGALVASDRVNFAASAAALPAFAAAPLLPAPPPPPPIDADCRSIPGPGGAKVAACPENASGSTSSSSGSAGSATSSSIR